MQDKASTHIFNATDYDPMHGKDETGASQGINHTVSCIPIQVVNASHARREEIRSVHKKF